MQPPAVRGGSASLCSPARAAGAAGPRTQTQVSPADARGAWGATGAAGACGSTGAGAAAGTAWRSAAWRRRAAGLGTAGTPSAGILTAGSVGAGFVVDGVTGTAAAAVDYDASATVSAADFVACVACVACVAFGGCIALVGCVALVEFGVHGHGVQTVRFVCAPAGKTPGSIVSSFGSVNASASANVSVCECGHDLRLWPQRWQPTHAMSSHSPSPLARPLCFH